MPKRSKTKESKLCYVVTALHDTGHGQVASVILVTEDPDRAVQVARDAEELDYEFHENDTYVAVTREAYDAPVRKHGNALVFIRRRVVDPDKHGKRAWREQHFDV
ncbi:hypothetical protein HY480_02370 [Candidatus Uhrbacteria bacterium]|nr:hypothetical protein [Candidatus Uhrbacteria bacterium]